MPAPSRAGGSAGFEHRHIREMLWEIRVVEEGDIYKAYVDNMTAKVVGRGRICKCREACEGCIRGMVSSVRPQGSLIVIKC